MATDVSNRLERRFRLLPSAGTSRRAPEAESLGPVKRAPLLVGLVAAVVLTAVTWSSHGAKPGILLLLGIGLGVALFHARFGFTSAWRQLVSVGNGTGLRAHTLLLGTTATLFALIIGTGTGLFGTTPTPSSAPVGVGLIIGAFVFAIGMQLAGACASGTLYIAGSGSVPVVLALLGFIAGSTLAAWQFDLWRDLPAFDPVLFSDRLGWFGSWLLTMVLLAVVYAITRVVQARRNPPPVAAPPSARTPLVRVVRGSWPLAAGALALAVLGAGVLLVSGGAWGVTSAFALWGSKFVGMLGASPESWSYFQDAAASAQLQGPVLADKTSLTDIGIIVGAMVAAAAGGVWKLHRSVPARLVVASLLGGVLMGVGARLASGCNIGAYLAGIASGNPHGWIWGAVALLGTWVGLKLRPAFGLAVPKPSDSSC